MKIYIVTQGTYSDYHIEQVFSTLKKAQEYLDHIGNEDSQIEEYSVDNETPRGTFEYCVTFLHNSHDAEVKLTNFYDSPSCRKDVFSRGNSIGYDCIWFNIEAKDAPHAIKIASERLMQIEAMPYLFPRLKEKCVCEKLSNYVLRSTPVYDYNTKEILLKDGQYLEP